MDDNTPNDPTPPESPKDEPVEETTPETPDDDGDNEELTSDAFTPTQRPVDFNEELSTTEPLSSDPAHGETLALFREAYSTVNTVLERANDLLESINRREEDLYLKAQQAGRLMGDEDGNPWFRMVMNALPHAQINQMGENSAARDGSEWRQTMDYEGQSLRPGQPKQKLGAGHHTTEEKMTYLSRRAGVGTVFDVPLYHSGVWVRLKTPSLVALTGLQHQLSQLKVTLGSDSKGMAFSNTSQALTSIAVDFALQYVIDTNVHTSTPSDLKERILLLDAPVLLWGLAVTLYPKGYPYAHPCIADPEKCQHITKELLNLNRLLWTDTTSLSQTQKKLMARRFQKKLSEEEYELYHTEKVRGDHRVAWFDELGLTLKVPTLQEYEDSGLDWINGIVEMTQGAFNEPPHGANRDQYISQLAMATTARQYTHWISEVRERDEDGNDELLSNEPDVINETLNHIFSTDEFVEQYFGKITEYVDDAMVSMVAIPSFNCPKCASPVSEKFHERFHHLVPLDVLTTFFTLVNRKLS